MDEDILHLAKKYIREKHKRAKFRAGETWVGVADAQFDEHEIAALVEASLNWKIVDGEISHGFELDMAKFMGTRYATYCNSGSSANLLALMALTSPKLGSKAIQPGDEVITSGVGFPTTVAPILQAGAVPVFVDVALSSYNPTPDMISKAITEKTKAIFIAHTLGNPFDAEAYRDIADQNGLWLIEDSCDAIGGSWDGKNVGTFGHLSTTSFYPAHMMTTGEGGMVFTDSGVLNSIVRSFRDWGRDCWCLPNKDNTCGKRFSHKGLGELPDGYDHKYTYSHIGYNLKSTDLNASIGREQVKKLPTFIEKRRDNWIRYNEMFEDAELDKYFILPSHSYQANPAWFGFILSVKETAPFTRQELVEYLNSKKIATRNLFGGNITRQPAFIGKGRIADDLPKADFVMKNTFWIGVHPGLTIEMQEYVVDTVSNFVESKK